VSELELKAQTASSVIPATELHGLVCGFATGKPEEFSLSDFVQLAGTDALSDEAAVSDFVSASLDELYAPDMTFAPFVPGDEEELSARLVGLSEWCAGFLSGFGAAYNNTEETQATPLPLELQEILKDFASISSIDDDVDGDEQDEGSFMEIYEYVRVAAVLAMNLVADAEDAAQDQD